MAITETETDASGSSEAAQISPTNTVAVAGAAFGVIAMGLYAGLFYWVWRLPNSSDDLRQLQTDTPTLLKLVALGGSGTILNLVALVLCITGLLLPLRSRWLALAGTIIFGAMFLGIACVVLLGTLAP